MCVYTVPVLIYLLKGQYYTSKVTGFYCILKKSKQKKKKEQRKERLILVVGNNVNLLFISQCPSHGEAGGESYFFLKVQREGGTFVEGLFKKAIFHSSESVLIFLRPRRSYRVQCYFTVIVNIENKWND